MEPTDLNLTVTQREQCMVEAQVFGIYKHFSDLPSRAQTVMLELVRDKHIEYLTDGLQQLGSSFRVLDANRPWLCYWILHSLALLGEYVDDELENNAVDFLNRCQDPNGGYSGGPGQMPHLATTYAAVNALVTLGGQRSLSSINRDKLYTFLRRMKDPSGGFRMHEAGEIDVRACYTAISVASVLNILDQELVENVGNYILSCQTYEGGIAGEPGSEAHANLQLDWQENMLLPLYYLLSNIGFTVKYQWLHHGEENWVVFRQGVECGFQGRTNKLVDGCYSFWQGGVFSLIQRLRTVVNEQLVMMDDGKQDGSSRCTQIPVKSHASERKQDSEGTSSQYDESRWEQGGAPAGLPRSPDLINLSNIGLSFVEQHTENGPLFHSLALQQYILLCSQVLNGGFRDKPGKARDYYHTCYCLSGLSVCQYSCSKDLDSSPLPHALFGPYSNLVESVHPLYNIVLNRYHAAHDFFRGS